MPVVFYILLSSKVSKYPSTACTLYIYVYVYIAAVMLVHTVYKIYTLCTLPIYYEAFHFLNVYQKINEVKYLCYIF